ncbi:MAG: efflux RND transporter periplasmic adaptor subunit [Armatimonadetes bacterium]|nr:efflux RND transporter periplasmic adaptor subunit [Armatimonadota bacterium]MBS1711714.1 efflux RND transporter periplasmic adaptor subunit [Armatimonadota bacterium]MBX3109732.1 efflux RND transporter periplasmic adaptor subunit [Fimbriimonadaceae bacterium]
MKPWKIALFILIPLIIVVAFGAMAVSGSKLAQKKVLDDLVKSSVQKVSRGDVAIKVVETGSLEALSTVEVKSQVGGRVARLLVDEGDYVEKGQLVAVIDPQQTELQVQQSRAQLDGANSSVRQIDVQIAQRRVTAKTNLEKAKIRVKQLELELNAQPTLTNASIRSAQTALESAQKSYDLLVKVTQPNQRTSSETARQDAQNNVNQAQLEADRQQGLYAKGYVSKREVEQADLSLELAKTKLRQAGEALQRLDNEQRLERERAQKQIDQAQADLDRAKANSFVDQTKKQDYQTAVQNLRDAEAALKDVDALVEQRRGSKASVAQIESSLNENLRLLGETEVRAPISGVVTKRYVQMGELVNALSTFSAGSPIVKIEDRSKMIVKLEINEIDVARLLTDMEAEITVDALPDSTFTGRVTKISPAQIENAAGVGGDPVVKYAVEVTLDRVEPKLKSGMSAKCDITPSQRKDVLRLPLAFVGMENGQSYVMLYDPKEVPKADPKKPLEKPQLKGIRKDIEVGLKDQAFIEIRGGLKEGDQVVRPPFGGPARKGMMQFGPGDDEENKEGENKDGQSSSSSSSKSESGKAGKE